MDEATIIALSADSRLVNLFAQRLMIPPPYDNGFWESETYYEPRSKGAFYPQAGNGAA